MPGQCYSCGVEFGVFKKEHGCKHCGFAFCNKCLNEKSIPVPKRNNEKHHVCQKCFKILTGAAPESTKEKSFELPEAYLKRVAALKERGARSSSYDYSLAAGREKIPEHLRKMDKIDRDIAMRLEKLKEEDKPKEKVSDADLNAKLAQLKGQSYIPDKKPVYKPPDRRPEAQKVDDLLEQLAREAEIDSLLPDPAKDIESRLARLREDDSKKNDSPATTASKPNVDDNNINLDSTRGKDTNNLNKVDKMESITKPYSQNIGSTKCPGAVGGGGGQELDMEEMQRLLAEAAKELEQDAKRALEGMQKDKELVDRLKEVQKRKNEKKILNDAAAAASDSTAAKGAGIVTATVNDHEEDSEDDDSAAKRIIQRYLDEVEIDKAVGDSNSSPKATGTPSTDKRVKGKKKSDTFEKPGTLRSKELKVPPQEELVDSDYDDSDELPYCCICTEDATVRCHDCDMDLYCQKCFKECHVEMDITDHRISPYKAPKGYR